MTTSYPFKTVLIANRGEIALRIQATCHALGLKTVAIYTEEDQWLSYVYQANTALKLPQNGPLGYLNQDALISLAHKSNSDAIHPGYGFLSENYKFAQKVIDAGLTWIGPTPKSISLLADKTQAQKTIQKAGIPTIPGITFPYVNQIHISEAKDEAYAIGFPVLLKCAHGGGGKAMRRVDAPEQFETMWNTVISEAKNFFNSESILLEKYLSTARHIEIQVAGDGNEYIHMYERECSIQRRHQKIIEESPCSFISQKTKQDLYKAALKVAQSVSYKSIGTVEFLVTPTEEFYFLEMNTRLQVEHSVTECITGIDLVELQLHLAAQKHLPIKQDDISMQGHALECRIYAEDPNQAFAPSAGIITHLEFPHNPFVRIDHDLETEIEITPFFDPMIAKITTKGLSRNNAISYMNEALRTTQIYGIKTNINFLQNILSSKTFSTGKIHTQLLENKNYQSEIFTQNHNKKTIQEITLSPQDVIDLATHFKKQTKIKSNIYQNSSWKIAQWK